jgi:hypothetical protein
VKLVQIIEIAILALMDIILSMMIKLNALVLKI